jgi:hypothetical protein
MKKAEEFLKVIEYITTVGFRNKSEMETYLKEHGFGVKHLCFYSDDENNHLMFKVDFVGEFVDVMNAIENPLTIADMRKFDGAYIAD